MSMSWSDFTTSITNWFNDLKAKFSGTSTTSTQMPNNSGAQVLLNGQPFGTVLAYDASGNIITLPSGSYNLTNTNVDVSGLATVNDINSTNYMDEQCSILSLKYDTMNKFNAILGTSDTMDIPTNCDPGLFPTPMPNYKIKSSLCNQI
jgi:hypothetical protein